MNILFLLIFGAIVGWLASIIMKTNHKQGLLMDIILGVVGSIVGGWLMDMMGGTGVTGFNLYSILVGVVGAVILIALGRMFTGSSARA